MEMSVSNLHSTVMFAKKFHLNAFCVLRLLHLCKTNDVSIIFVIVETGFDIY